MSNPRRCLSCTWASVYPLVLPFVFYPSLLSFWQRAPFHLWTHSIKLLWKTSINIVYSIFLCVYILKEIVKLDLLIFLLWFLLLLLYLERSFASKEEKTWSYNFFSGFLFLFGFNSLIHLESTYCTGKDPSRRSWKSQHYPITLNTIPNTYQMSISTLCLSQSLWC